MKKFLPQRSFATLRMTILGVALFFFLNVEAFAFTLGTDAPKLRLSIKPGETKAGAIQVNNSGNKAVKVKAYLSDWVYKPEGDGNKNFLPPGTTPLSCAKWVNLNPTEFELYPDETRSVNYLISVPKDASGGHYAVIFFESDMGVQEIKGSQVKVRGRVGSLIYIESEGHVERKGEITDLKILPPQGGNPLMIEVSFANEGNVDLTAVGTFHVIDPKGNIYARDKLAEMYTLPGDKVKAVTKWSGTLQKGDYDVVLTYDLGNNQTIVKEAKLEIP